MGSILRSEPGTGWANPSTPLCRALRAGA